MDEAQLAEILKTFSFGIPVETVEGDGTKFRIRGIASTQAKDGQGEVVVQKGLDISKLIRGEGLFNWDHGKGPENTIGKIDKAEMTPQGLFVEGYLFPHTERGKAVIGILKSLAKGDERRLKLSVEGQILKRGGSDNKKVLAAKVSNVALTFDPVNPDAFAEFVKSWNDEVEKDEKNDEAQLLKGDVVAAPGPSAITTGNYDVPPGQLKGGAALTKEDLDKEKKDLKDGGKKKKQKKHTDALKVLIGRIRKSYPDLALEKQVELAFRIYEEKIEKK